MFCARCGSVNADGVRFCKGCGSPLDASGAAVATSGAAFSPVYARPAPQFRYAGFWRRFVAMIIDGLVFSPFFLIFLATTGTFGVLGETNRDLEGAAAAMFGLGILALGLAAFAGTWLYHTLMESSRHQATLGKMALGVIVTDLNGNRISFARANGRFFGKWVSGIIMNIGYLMAAFTEKKQALHDMLARCLVILK
jgi:uncharacterized RDD family membrane protein YckC